MSSFEDSSEGALANHLQDLEISEKRLIGGPELEKTKVYFIGDIFWDSRLHFKLSRVRSLLLVFLMVV